MFKTVFEKDPMDPTMGQKYRDEILKVGGSRWVLYRCVERGSADSHHAGMR